MLQLTILRLAEIHTCALRRTKIQRCCAFVLRRCRQAGGRRMAGFAAAAEEVDASSLLAGGGINLAVGHPAQNLLPHALLSRACLSAAQTLASGPSADWQLSYGRIAGDNSVRAALSTYLGRCEQNAAGVDFGPGSHAVRPPGAVNPQELFITAGISHGLETVTAALCKRGDTVVVVKPTYFLASGVFVDGGLNLAAVDADEESGLDVDQLESMLRGGLRPRMLYVVTTHANPTGRTLTPAARHRLVQLAMEYRFFILADEVYHLLSWGKEPVPPRLRAYIPTDAADAELQTSAAPDAAPLEVTLGNCVVSLASFSKLLAPGLRVGWIEAAPSVLARISNRGYLISGGGVTPFSSRLVQEVLTSGGQDAHLALLRTELRARCDAMCAALRRHAVTCRWSFMEPRGGYFVWLRLPAGMDGAALTGAAKTRGVSILAGANCCALGPSSSDSSTGVAKVESHVRLCFAYLSVPEIERGVELLAEACESLMQ
jgi:2-aminoadipate transaminase